jgi:ABC-type uncharacterized transport system substrate-binding protein
MRRRTLVAAIGATIVRPLTAIAQQPAHRPLIGVLSPITKEAAKVNVDAFRGALRALGYVEDESIAVEFRFAGGRVDALAALAVELVALRPDVIVVGSYDGVVAARKATETIPLVGVGLAFDPVALGLVASYARPGGNVTGFHLAMSEAKRGTESDAKSALAKFTAIDEIAQIRGRIY